MQKSVDFLGGTSSSRFAPQKSTTYISTVVGVIGSSRSVVAMLVLKVRGRRAMQSGEMLRTAHWLDRPKVNLLTSLQRLKIIN
jgi:hypothetical protein